MKCEHVHKDAPENSLCEDCFCEYRHKQLFPSKICTHVGCTSRKFFCEDCYQAGEIIGNKVIVSTKPIKKEEVKTFELITITQF